MDNLSAPAKAFWDEFSRNPLSKEILTHLLRWRGVYNGTCESPSLHLQSEYNGGHKAWNKLSKKLLAGPEHEKEEDALDGELDF